MKLAVKELFWLDFLGTNHFIATHYASASPYGCWRDVRLLKLQKI